ncbi:MAG: hypothetical protein WKG03_07365 [Telluria sp.]
MRRGLIAAPHRAGLATLTHTPSPMGFLNKASADHATRCRTCCWWSAIRRKVSRPDIERLPLEAYADFL